LVSLDSTLASEIQDRLRAAGWDRGRAGGSIFAPMWPNEAEPSEPEAGRPAIGKPRPLPDGWDQWWQDALVTWMSVENLEERIVAPGWIDPQVLKFLRNLSTP
jgi:hypothetical protein